MLAAIVLGALFGLAWPDAGASLEPLGDVFIAAIQMLIGPVVFCTIVTGIASAGQLASVGRVGWKSLVYFEALTTLALIVGLVVMNVFHPGSSLHASPHDLKLSATAKGYVGTAHGEHWYDFLVGIVPGVDGRRVHRRQRAAGAAVAITFAIALRGLGERAAPIVDAIERLGEVVFGMVRIVMYFAPFGAFGAMAFAVGKFGLDTLSSLAAFVGLFWATGIVFAVVVFGLVSRACGVNLFKLYRYFKDELLITLGTANYEAVMPQLISKLERLGLPKRVVGLVVPAGYAFNGDGVCLYLGFAALYIAQAFGVDLSLGQQIGLLAVFLITSKGSAGVAGAGFVILAATISTTGTVPIVGIMLILGVDRFLSTMRGLVSLNGQMVGSIVIFQVGGRAGPRAHRALGGARPRARCRCWHEPPRASAARLRAAARPPSESARGAAARSRPLDRMLLHSPPVADGWNSLLGAIRSARRCRATCASWRSCASRRSTAPSTSGRAHEPVGAGGRARRRRVASPAIAQPAPFDDVCGAVLAYTDAMTRDVEVADAVFEAVGEHFDVARLVELTATIAPTTWSRASSWRWSCAGVRAARRQGRDRHRRGQRRRRAGATAAPPRCFSRARAPPCSRSTATRSLR